MKFPYRMMVFSAVVALFLAAGCGGRQAAKQESPTSPRALFEAKCSFCHGLNLALEQNHTLAGWQALVKKEAGRKIWFIGSGEQEAIARYLFEVAPADKEPAPMAEPLEVNQHDHPERDRN